MAGVTLSEIDKTYPDGFEAVNELSLDIADGEFLVLVGPSGCGKSTALRMIAGLEEITGGTLSIGDRVVNKVHPKDRNVAMVFQSYALYPHMTVAENIGFALKLSKVSKTERNDRVRKAAQVLELEDQLDRKPGQLSGGQRQRVAMGRAIVRQPAAFLMDEPLSNLDVELRVQMRAEISGIQKELGVTTIYVTHDQVEAMTMGDRVAVMKDGVLQQVDKPKQLYNHPVNIFVAAFIGSPSMNIYEATLKERQVPSEAVARCGCLPARRHAAPHRGHLGAHLLSRLPERPPGLHRHLDRTPDQLGLRRRKLRGLTNGSTGPRESREPTRQLVRRHRMRPMRRLTPLG